MLFLRFFFFYPKLNIATFAKNSAYRGPTFIFGTLLSFVLLNELMLCAILVGARFSIADEILAIFAIIFGSILCLTFSIQ